MKVYVIMEDCIDPYFGPELVEDGVCYKSKEDAEKKIQKEFVGRSVYVEELEVK